MLKGYLADLWFAAMQGNKDNILYLLGSTGQKNKVLLDLGCDDGEWSMRCAGHIGAAHVLGVDIVRDRLNQASVRGLLAIEANLDGHIPLGDASVDLIHANQVIEHVGNVDNFAKEIYRILKPGGYGIISTENAASWCNILALIFGWQMFSLTNMSSICGGIGNPLALHRRKPVELSSWTHKTLFSYLGLIEFFEAHGFIVSQVAGAGYFPLPYCFGRLDRRHAHFLSILLTRPK